MKLELIEPKSSHTVIVNACLDTCERICAAPTMIKELAKLLERTKTKPFEGSTDILEKMLESGKLTLEIEKSGNEIYIKPVGKVPKRKPIQKGKIGRIK
ncbi:MAG: hypothetical protein ACTSYB_05320 [Candidatus Helarchaeota archaeon]